MPTAPSSDIAFTPTIKAIQTRKDSRRAYASMEERGGWQTTITADLAAFIGTMRSVYLATVNAEGQPYIQHRGGPPGFLKVLDETRLAFADFKETGSSSRKAISRRTRRPFFSSWITRIAAGSRSGVRHALWRMTPNS